MCYFSADFSPHGAPTKTEITIKKLAERSFDLRTSELWARPASTAPLCYLVSLDENHLFEYNFLKRGTYIKSVPNGLKRNGGQPSSRERAAAGGPGERVRGRLQTDRPGARAAADGVGGHVRGPIFKTMIWYISSHTVYIYQLIFFNVRIPQHFSSQFSCTFLADNSFSTTISSVNFLSHFKSSQAEQNLFSCCSFSVWTLWHWFISPWQWCM